MDGIAASLIIKLIAMVILVIVIFLIALYLLKDKLLSGSGNKSFRIIDTVFINNKDRILDFQYKDNAYIIYTNQNSCVLLDKKECHAVEDNSVNSYAGDTFKNIINRIYKL